MKSILPLLLLVLSSTNAVCSQTVVSKNAHQKPQLELATRIVEQHSCATHNLGFTLNFTVRNTGDLAVILDKTILISNIMVSRDYKSAATKRYEQELRYDLFETPKPAPADLSSFVILSPGNVYEFEDRVSVSVNDGSPVFAVGLGPGTHFLQVGVATWSYMVDPVIFQKQWRDKGYLWSKALTSLPMSFTVDLNRPVKACK
jgi:hypothetical protein